jgi:hypothetical protein
MLKTFARSKTKSQSMHTRVGRSMQRNCLCTVSLSGYLCKTPKWHQDTQANKEEHDDKDKLKRAKTKSQRMHVYIWTAMSAWWSCGWQMRNCFCTAQVFVSLCKIVSRPQGTENEGSGKITKSELTRPKTTKRSENARAWRAMRGWSDMMRDPAPGSLSGY